MSDTNTKIQQALAGVSAIGNYAASELGAEDLARFHQSLSVVLQDYDLLGEEATANALSPGCQMPTCTVVLHCDGEDDTFLLLNCASTDEAAIYKAVREHVEAVYGGQDVDGEVYATHVFDGQIAARTL